MLAVSPIEGSPAVTAATTVVVDPSHGTAGLVATIVDVSRASCSRHDGGDKGSKRNGNGPCTCPRAIAALDGLVGPPGKGRTVHGIAKLADTTQPAQLQAVLGEAAATSALCDAVLHNFSTLATLASSATATPMRTDFRSGGMSFRSGSDSNIGSTAPFPRILARLGTSAFRGFVVERVHPCGGVSTLLSALRSVQVPDRYVKAWLTQALAALWYLRYRIPYFRHNDFKTDNILLSAAPPQEAPFWAQCTTGLPVEAQAAVVAALSATSCRVVIIDLELVYAPSLGLTCPYASLPHAGEFGVCTADTPWADIHLLLYDALRVVEDAIVDAEARRHRLDGVRLHARRAWLQAFVQRHMPEDWFGPPVLTEAHRLHPDVQATAPPADWPAILSDVALRV